MVYGESKYVVMFGGLYIEMVLWSVCGDFLEDLGWIIVLVEVGIVLFGIVELFLKVIYLM